MSVSELALSEVFVLPPAGTTILEENGSGLSNRTIQKIKDEYGMCDKIAAAEVVEIVADEEGIKENNEARMKLMVVNKVLSYDDYMHEKRRIKVEAPWQDTPLTNAHIDDVLEQFSLKFKDFYHYYFCMANFLDVGDRASLNKISPVALHAQGYRSWACVLNTDIYTGRGKHWVCIYGDMRDEIWTLEYFNSSSNPPIAHVTQWFNKVEAEINEKHRNVIVRRIINPNDYQRGEGHHCGVYVLIYIWQRLNGVPADKYLRKKISNSHVLAFRRYLFTEGSAH